MYKNQCKYNPSISMNGTEERSEVTFNGDASTVLEEITANVERQLYRE